MDMRSPEVANAASPPPAPAAAAFDGARLWAALRRRLPIAAGVALAVLAADAVVTLSLPKAYTATAKVMLDRRPQKIVEAQPVLADVPTDVTGIDTQVEVLRSRGLAERLTTQLRLERDPAFNPRLRPKGWLGTGLGAAAPEPPPTDPAALAHLRQTIADDVMHRVRVSRSGLTSVIDIAATAADAERAGELANTLADLYLTDQLEAKFDATRRAADWLNGRLSGLRDQVQAADAALQAYKIEHGLLVSEGSTLTEQSVAALNTQLAEARAGEAEAQARVATAREQVAKGSSGEDTGAALGSPVIQQLRAQRAEVSKALADLSGRYGPKHPEMLKAQRQLADTDAQIQAEVRRVLSGLEAQAEAARQRTASLAGSLTASRSVLATNTSAAVRLNELQRNAESARALYQSYLDRFRQTSTQQGVEQPEARILSRARTPSRPSSPKPLLALAVGLVLATVAAAAAVAILEATQGGFSTAEEVEKRLDLDWLGAVPELSSTLNRVSARLVTPGQAVVERPKSHFAESLRALRVSLLHALSGAPVHLVVVTSALPSEGKSTTALGLARSAAIAGQSVVVVNADRGARDGDPLLLAEPGRGLLDVLAERVTLDEALRPDPLSAATILPLAPTALDRDSLSSPQMDRLLEALRGRFDLVILDTAPVLAAADTRPLASKADAVLLLARWRKTPRAAVERALRALETVDATVAGVALTRVDVREQARTGYGDPGFYYRHVSQYYVN